MWNELYFYVAIGCALFVYLLDYAFGQPGNDRWNPSELLSRYALWLAVRRLKSDGAIEQKYQQLIEGLKHVTNDHEAKLLVKNYRLTVFTQARETFYWEKAAGMCPICFHIWVALIIFSSVNYFYLSVNIFYFGFWLLFSHLIIRFLKKFV